MVTHSQIIQTSDWSRDRILEILKSFKNRKVLVVGDLGVDRYTIGQVERISPEAPVPIVLVEEEQLKLGLAANVADNVVALGGNPLLCGVIGQDRFGDDFKGLVSQCGIASEYITVSKQRRTVLKERVVSERQQLLRIDYESTSELDIDSKEHFLSSISKLIPQSDVVILQDYAKGTITPQTGAQIISLCKQNQKMVLVDPHAKANWNTYIGCDVFTPNKKEAEALSGCKIVDQESLLEVGNLLLKTIEAKNIVMTLGKDGIAIFKKGESHAKCIPTYSREVYDVSGAGDTVVAVLALALASDAQVDEGAVLANIAAGIEVSKRGTATVSPEEIQLELDRLSEVSS